MFDIFVVRKLNFRFTRFFNFLGFAAPSACLQEKETGSCKAYFTRYYFNKETGNCESFIYGGCRGNSNNFNTLEDCEAVCKGTK